MHMDIKLEISKQTPCNGEQRMLDIALQWRDLAASTRIANLRPLYLSAARAVELQVRNQRKAPGMLGQISKNPAVQ